MWGTQNDFEMSGNVSGTEVLWNYVTRNRACQGISVRLLVKVTAGFSATVSIPLCESGNEM